MRRLLEAAGPFFILAGVLHFVTPKTYEQIMPKWLPWHRELVYASGVTEAIGGAALMSSNPKVRQVGGIIEGATMVGVFPANLNMALNADKFKQVPGGKPALYARLPIQAVIIAWIWAAATRD